MPEATSNGNGPTGNPESAGAEAARRIEAGEDPEQVLRDQARRSGEDLQHMLRDQAERSGEQGRQTASRWLQDVTDALAEAGSKLQADGHEVTAFCIHSATDQIDRLGGYVEGRSVGDLAEDYADFARDRPLAAAGLAFAAGFGLVALLQARQPVARRAHDYEARRGDGGESEGSRAER
jgi:ElaB/YqjD/DUF883 family membrane-anchored ribosome-binding protein